MKRKILSLALAILMLCVFFTACGIDTTTKDKPSIEEQINLIAESTDIWTPFDIYPGDHFKFTVTDLDNNSRLEVITTVCRSTGLYSESMYYEVDENFTSLSKWEHKTDDFKEFLQADIINGKAECFINPDTNERFYHIGDSHKDTAAYSCNYRMCLTFKDKTVTEEMLAYWSIRAATTDEAGDYDITETIKTRDGETITRDEFGTFVDDYFDGFDKYNVAIKWQDLRLKDETLATDLPKSELVSLLTESFNGFAVTLAPSVEELSKPENQIKLIAENQNLWLGSSLALDYTAWEPTFCVTDLDNNGRLEVVCAATIGSGIFTDSTWSKVSSGFDSVINIKNDLTKNKNTGPEIIVDSTDCFVNPDTGERFYTFVDTVRASGDYSTHTKGLLTLKDNTVSFTRLATCTSIAENPEDITIRTYTYADTNGNSLTKEEFDSYIENHLEGYEKHTATFKWQKLNSDSDDANEEDIIKLLDESFKGFSVK